MEEERLLPEASRSRFSKGRTYPEIPCQWRTAFQRDRDRILHAKAFRRLGHKTQVFVAPERDHYRTRLTHTLEVAQVARTIGRLLALNEDLIESIALGHDLGHTPFGHAGEAALDSLLTMGFRHNEQSLRVVDHLERTEHPFFGLNLTWEVRDGILRHTGPEWPATWEGQVVRLADRIAYLNHDIDDAVRGSLLTSDELPSEVVAVIGQSSRNRLTTWVADVVTATRASGLVCQGGPVGEATERLREFLFTRLYIGSVAKAEEGKVLLMLTALYNHFISNLAEPADLASVDEDPTRRVADYIAGMTDRYAVAEFNRVFVPSCWAG